MASFARSALIALAVLLVCQVLAATAVEFTNQNGFQKINAGFNIREIEDSPSPVEFSPYSNSVDNGSPSPNSPGDLSPVGPGRTAGGIIGFVVACLMFIICILAMIPFCIKFFVVNIRNKLGMNKN
eukprot:CAMPEP_0114612738 /NCGR_PEP_ID=MMETSP0168-20121206/4774_1 /TAXON_ID=95228 ORGANISM="Vannella sp., Strain DIVA3 517/6/12" /NCGR_SAMPLE_ID=MMETSP0168 /ASSEMBLY_ACC=CAM_ASM_000044 /LENGTH=125 /DNA_ID=CAMNT_0001823727 /DNA_START=178 /DNA_END=555 /DNA_ORIENTATION=+